MSYPWGLTMRILESLLFLVIWIAIAFWPARVAGRKGHSSSDSSSSVSSSSRRP